MGQAGFGQQVRLVADPQVADSEVASVLGCDYVVVAFLFLDDPRYLLPVAGDGRDIGLALLSQWPCLYQARDGHREKREEPCGRPKEPFSLHEALRL